METKWKQQQAVKQHRSRDERNINAGVETRARELRKKSDLDMYEMMLQQQAASSFGAKEFLEMLAQARRPFCCEVGDHKVEITEWDCAMMLRDDVVETITKWF